MRYSEISNINEVQIGGDVDPDYLEDLYDNDYSNDQLDLFQEIPTLEPKLPPHLEIVGKMGGFYVVKDKKDHGHDGVTYTWFCKNKPISFMVVSPEKTELTNYLKSSAVGKQVNAVYIDKSFRGKGLGVGMYTWVLQNLCDYIVADDLQTRGGVKLWKKFQNSRLFDVEVFDPSKFSSRRRWPGKDFNHVYNNDDLVPWLTLRGKAAELVGNE